MLNLMLVPLSVLWLYYCDGKIARDQLCDQIEFDVATLRADLLN